MTESYIIPEFDENGNFLSDDVKARIAEMIESYIIPEFDENGNILRDDVKARIAEMIESYIIPEFDENGNILRDDVKARIVEMIKANVPAYVPSTEGPKVITLSEGHPNLAGTLAEPLPDDLPVGSYLVNDPPFMGYKLSQKTPFGWLPTYFDAQFNYNIPSYTTESLRAVVARGAQSVDGARFSGSVTITADSIRIAFDIQNMSFTKGEVVKVILEGPGYDLSESQVMSHKLDMFAAGGPTTTSHLLAVSSGGSYVNGERIPGILINVHVGASGNTLSASAVFDLKSTPDLRASDRMYMSPSQRVEVEVPEPTYVEVSDQNMSGTITIPEVEGVVWHGTFQGTESPEDILEPGVYRVPMADYQTFTVTAKSEMGYYITNNDGYQVPWVTRVSWDYSQGYEVTVPLPVALNATTEGGVEGWIVRYPEVEHVRYYVEEGYDENWTYIKKMVSGDAFTPLNKPIIAEADLPYYANPDFLGYLGTDGEIRTTDSGVA